MIKIIKYLLIIECIIILLQNIGMFLLFDGLFIIILVKQLMFMISKNISSKLFYI